MGNSLADQLKKSGLANKTKTQKIKHDQYKNKKKKIKKQGKGAAQVDESKQRAQQALAEKTQRDREANLKQQQKAEAKAIAAQIKQLIDTHRVQGQEGDVAYNFTDAKAIKRIYVSKQASKLLTVGSLAIAKSGDSYELVPKAVAEKIQQRDAQAIIMADQSEDSEKIENDPYADYEIPDDLMW